MLNRACSEIWEGVVELAEGRTNPEAHAHVSHCVRCSARLEEMRQLISATQTEFHDAPQTLVNSVLDLMPQVRRTVRAGLLRSTLAVLGSRSDADDFQLVLGAEDFETRLMYVRGEQGWDVIGRTPSPTWTVAAHGIDVEQDDDGRFSFHVPVLDQSNFVLTSGTLTVEVPSAEELLNGGAPGPR